MPGVQVPLVIQSTPQAITISPDEDVNGAKIAHLLVSMPMATFLVDLNEESGLRIIADLQTIFGKAPGLHIAREMPDGPNGSRPA